MRALIMLLFATTGGLALSGIVANLYRLLGRKSKSGLEELLHCLVMVFAGPSVLLENATNSFRRKDCSRLAYVFALTLSAYWCFGLGLLLILLSRL